MKKRLIALSVAAALGGVAGTASAQQWAETLEFNPDGVGHILIVPYFNTQSGNATLLNIVNTDTAYGKAVKVRFRGASNSDDVFDFQLFLSVGDVWTAAISQGADGLSRLSTSDNSCTLPGKSVLNSTPFITTRLNPDLTGDALANETREGYVEILNMANIASSTATSSVWVATKHNAAGVAPCTASVLENLTKADEKLTYPTTGLFANWTIINVPNTTVWSGEAAAIEARTDGVAAAGFNVFWPQTATSVAESAFDIADFSADPLFLEGVVDAAFYDLPDLSTPYVTGTAGLPQGQATLLSDAIATRSVAAEYLSSPSINASTDWVISKPTRRYYIAVDYSAATAANKLVSNFDDGGDFLADYYRSKESDGDPTGNTVMGSTIGGKSWQACTQISSLTFWNREELSPSSTGIVISPGTPEPLPSLCGEITVLGINSPVSPLGADVARSNLTLPGGLVDGWGRLTVNNTFEGLNLGLPMLVRQFSKATNAGVAAGVSGTFGAKYTGRVTERGYWFNRGFILGAGAE